MIVGSKMFVKSFERRIIRPHIFTKKEKYALAMINEITSRHDQESQLRIPELNIKEGRGGLRDIEMLLLTYKAYYGLRDPINSQIVETLIRIIPDRAEQLKSLGYSADCLRYIRDLYRLSVSAEDQLQTEHFGPVAKIVGYSDSIEGCAVDLFADDLKKRMTDIAAAIGLCQLGKLEDSNNKRIRNAGFLTERLSGIRGLVPPHVRPNVRHVFHQYTVRVTGDFPVSRDELRKKLLDKGIGTEVYYPLPVHRQALYQSLGYTDHVPSSEKAAREVLSLPVHPSLMKEDLAYIAESIVI